MADIGSLVANLMLNDAQFNRGLTNAARKTQSFSAKSNRYLAKAQQKWDSITKSVFSYRGALVAAAGATALGYMIKRNLDAADTIGKTADRIGISTDKLQEYRFMANRAGVETSQLDKGMEAFTKRLGELKAGTGALNTYLNKMDEEFKDQLISARSTGEALDLFMGKMAGLESASDKAALSAAAFSRSAGVAMVNLVRGGQEEVDKLRKTFEDLGLAIDEDLIRNAEEANDSLTNLTTVIKTEMMSVVLQVAPAIAQITDKITTWVKENRELLDQKIPEYVNKIKNALQKMWDVITYDPAIIEWGIIGLLFWGKKGAIIVGGLAHMVEWVKNLSAALALASAGVISFKEVAAANFKELEAIVKRFDKSVQGAMGNFVRMKIPKETLPTETWKKPGTPLPATTIDTETMRELSEIPKEVEETWAAINAKASEYGQLVMLNYELQEGIWQQAADKEIEIATQKAEQLKNIELMKNRFIINAEQSKNQILMGLGQAALAFAGANSKQIFLITKGIEVAQAVMAAHAASAMALAHPPGPPTTIPLAAAALKAGLMNAAAIAATTLAAIVPTKGASAGAAMGTYSASPYTGAPEIPSETLEPSGPRLEIHINGPITGEESMTWLIDRLNDWVEDKGGRLIASETVI